MTQTLNIIVDISRCTGCRMCELVCAVYHEGAVNLDGARIRIRDDYEHSLFEPHICQLCDPPPCVDSCPMVALKQDSQTKVINVNDQLCDGCEACVQACPYDAIWWSQRINRLFVCDRCEGEPICVQFCTSKALQVGFAQVF